MSSTVTVLPSSKRSMFSSTTFSEAGKRLKSPRPAASAAAIE